MYVYILYSIDMCMYVCMYVYMLCMLCMLSMHVCVCMCMFYKTFSLCKHVCTGILAPV